MLGSLALQPQLNQNNFGLTKLVTLVDHLLVCPPPPPQRATMSLSTEFYLQFNQIITQAKQNLVTDVTRRINEHSTLLSKLFFDEILNDDGDDGDLLEAEDDVGDDEEDSGQSISSLDDDHHEEKTVDDSGRMMKVMKQKQVFGGPSKAKRRRLNGLTTTSRSDDDHHHDHQLSESSNYTILSLNCFIPNCTTTHTTSTALEDHLTATHGIHPYRCLHPGCLQSFPARHHLHSHLREHPNPTWRCTVCQSVYRNQTILRLHYRAQHQSGRFRCITCKFLGTTRSEVTTHYTKQHGTLSCTICTKSFTTNYSLQRHRRTHSSLKPYRCKWSGCRFRRYRHFFHATAHVRHAHFGLPATISEQKSLGIEDDRNAGDYVEMVMTDDSESDEEEEEEDEEEDC